MIRIPQVQLSVPQAQGSASGFANVVQTPTSDAGQSMQQLANSMASVGIRLAAMGEKAVDHANVGKSRKQVGVFREGLTNIVEGKDGYLYKLGEAAVDGQAETFAKIESLVQSFNAEGKFDNDVQRDMFTQAVQADLLRARIVVQAHGEKQAKVFNASTAKADYGALTLSMQRMGWSKASEAQLREAISAYQEPTGISQEEADLLFRAQLSKGLAGYIENLIGADDFDGAQKALDAAYDREDKDGNKRDKLIGGARGNLTNKLQSAKALASRRDETNAKEAARQASLAQGRDDATGLFSSYLTKGFSPDEAYSRTLSDLTQLIRPGGLSGTEAVTPEAWDVFRAGVSALESIGRGGLNQQRKQELDAADQAETFVDGLLERGSVMTADQMEQALQEEMGESFGLLTPKQRQKLRLKQQGTRSAALKARQEREDADIAARADALLHPTMTPDSVFKRRYPYTEEGDLQFREDTQPMTKAMAKEMVTRREQLFERPVTDQAFAGERTQVLSYLENQPWAAQREVDGTLRIRPDGTYAVDRTFSAHIAKLWSNAQQEAGRSGTKENFSDWLQKNFTNMTPDMMAKHAFREGDDKVHYIPRSMLPAFGGSVTERHIQRTTRFGDTYGYGEAKETPQQDPAGSGNNVLDLIMHYERSKPLVGQRKYTPMTGDEMAQAEAIFMSLPRESRTYEGLKTLGPSGYGALRMSERPMSPEFAESQASPAVRIMHRDGTLYTKSPEERASLLQNRAAVAVTSELSPSIEEMKDKEYLRTVFAPAVKEKYQQYELEAKRLLDSEGFDEMVKKEQREERLDQIVRGGEGDFAAFYDLIFSGFDYLFGGSEDEK